MPSSVQSSADSSARGRVAPSELVFTDWGLRDRPLSSLVAIIFATGLGWLAGWAVGSLASGIVIFTLLIATLWRTLVPVQYEFGISGITEVVLGWTRRIPWSAIKQHEIRADGVLLLADSPAAAGSLLRGIFLHFGTHRREVCEHLQYHLQDWSASVPAGGAGSK